MQREMLSVKAQDILKTLTLTLRIITNMKFHHTKLVLVLFNSGKSKKDVRENMCLYMDKLNNRSFSLQSAYMKNLQHHPVSSSHYVAARTGINRFPWDKKG